MREHYCLFFVVFFLARNVGGIISQENKFIKKDDFSNKLCSTGQLFGTCNVNSVFKCAKSCALNSDCLSFFYNRNGSCQYHNTVLVETISCIEHSETLYYIRGDYIPATSTVLLETMSNTLQETTANPLLETTSSSQLVATSNALLEIASNALIQATSNALLLDTTTNTPIETPPNTLLETTSKSLIDATSNPLLETTSVSLIDTSTAQLACDADWMPIGASCYKVTPGGTSLYWDDAKTYCISIGGYLAVLDTEMETQPLKDYLVPLGTKDYYIGASDLETEGIFKWNNTGELLNLPGSSLFHDWFPSHQPDNGKDKANQHCVVVYGNGNYKWNDVLCTYDREFICESNPV